MKIWVDADACPVVIKNILYKAADRTGTRVTLVANQKLNIPKSNHIDFIKVDQGFDVADNEIVKRVDPGDLVITSDIPLAADILEKGARPLSPRGELFSENDIKAKLTMRDFLDTLRSAGVETGGPPALSQRDRQNFANHLDRILAARKIEN